MCGSSAVRKLTDESGAKHPELLRSTKFRKQIATLIQLMRLQKDELHQVSKFMGHTEKTHMEFYRMTESTYQTAKVAKILMTVTVRKGRVRWEPEQKNLVLQEFKRHIKRKVLPTKQECLDFMNRHSIKFDKFDWSRIKTLVYNTYRLKEYFTNKFNLSDLGIYSRRLLWKHKKICPENKDPNKPSSLRISSYASGFSINCSKKKDMLICAFGARYLSTHRELHHINVCSRQMRELAKVLIESKKADCKIKNFYDLLHPKYFDIVVNSTKIVAKYDTKNEVFKSPTFAMNISRSIKDCCSIAILHQVKQKHTYGNITSAEAEANISMFEKLLETTWRYEISSKAGTNDARNKSEKCLSDKTSFNILMETAFCRLLLLNRKRVGELQRMPITSYTLNHQQGKSTYEEFSDSISPSESILLQHFKLVVIRGKRGRGVPVLFSKDIQEHMDLLISARPHVLKHLSFDILNNSSEVLREDEGGVDTGADKVQRNKKKKIEHFQAHIKSKGAPKKEECELLRDKYPILKNKCWTKIKVFVQNRKDDLTNQIDSE
nr:unnamed protein product [Callosobruchus analis]